jgi:hypothetical protein
MAFKPTFINGRHYLMSKNSGSFPNWAIYLSGSAGAGKLWSEFNINASVSCSYSSSTVFQTGSVYQVDVKILPALSASAIYVNGQTEGGALGNGGGSLSNTASLFVGNFSQNNTQNFSGSIYTVKSYTVQSLQQPPLNFNATATRFSKPFLPYVASVFELLVVAGGGGGGSWDGCGGGAGGVISTTILTTNLPSTLPVIVGQGGPGVVNAIGNNGSNSVIHNLVAFGGGGGAGGGASGVATGSNGGSGGGSNKSAPGGLGTLDQGNPGGAGTGGDDGGGGGGAGSAGRNASGKNGGSGSYFPQFSTIGGSPAGWFGGGGGGGGGYLSLIISGGLGGIGGGGNGLNNNPNQNGTSNTGGGGGAARNTGVTSGNGGSGIVALRYSGAPIALGGEITQSAGFTYHVFRTVGTSSFTIF